nr:retrovirus-related Pol polyprotein from transposon TNT 1-94 [Tanacetum cinerariifolium]
MVACLNKSDASEGFNQVIDFLNGSYIKLQALVDKKKLVITKAAIREFLRLDDAEGVDCLPNEEIFAELARMGYEKPSIKLTFCKAFFSSQWKFLIHTILQSLSAKRTSWNEFSSAIASAVICLSTGKGFSGVETPLFEGMIVEQVLEEGGAEEEHVEDDSTAQGNDTTAQTDDAQEPSVPSPTPPTLPPQQPQDLPSTSQALDACTALTRRSEHLEYDKVAHLEIIKLERREKKLEKGNRVKVLKLRRLKKVRTSQRIDTSEDTVMEDVSNQGRIIDDLDKNDAVALMDDKEEDKEEAKVGEDDQVQGMQAEIYKIDMDLASKVLSMQEDEPAEVQEVVDVVTTAKLITEVVTVASEIVTAASTIISTAEPQVPAATITVAPTPAEKAAKRRKLNEEVEDLKRHLEIVPDEDDDVYTEATPLARKMDKLKSERIKGLYMVKQRLRAGSYWNRVCMRTRSKSYSNNSNATISKRSNRRRVPNIVKPESRTEEVVPMADRIMEELLQAPTEGDVLNDAIKLLLFSYSLEGSARIWVNIDSRDSVSKTDDIIDKLADQILNLVEIVNKQVITPATAKAVEKTCVICGGAYTYYDCIATDRNQPSVCAATGTYNQVSPPNRASYQIPPPGFSPVQNNPNRYNQNQGQGNNFNRGNNFQNNQGYRAPMNNALNFQNQGFQNQPFQASTSVTLLSNIVPNPKGKMKAVATRSGLAYEGPLIPTNFPLEKTQPKPTIPYPSRLNDQKLSEKATNQMEKFFQIFHDLHFDISFTNALLLMPKFASTIKSLLTNKDKLFELAKVPLNENCSAMLLKKLPEKLRDPGKFLIPCDFPGIDEITLRVNDESVTFNLNQTMRYSLTYDDNSMNRVDVIDITCEEFVQDMLDFQYNPKSSNPTLVSNPSNSKNESCKEPIVKSSSPTLTPFGESDFFLEEIKDFLNDESIPTRIESVESLKNVSEKCRKFEKSSVYLCLFCCGIRHRYLLPNKVVSQPDEDRGLLVSKEDEPLSETKPSRMKQEDWALLERHALGVVRISLAKNVTFNVVNEKTTFGLLKALSNMYEKPSASNKVFLIRQLVNTKMTEGAAVADHVTMFNSVISKLLSIDIKFNDEMQALLLLSSLPDSWSGTVTAVSSTSGTNKLTFEGIRDMIIGEDIRKRNYKEYPNSLLSVTGHGKKSNRSRSGSRKKLASGNTGNITCWNCGKKRDIINQCEATKGVVNVSMDAFDDALLCCVEEYYESWVMDSGALFYATPSMGMMKNFKPLLRKVRLADMKVLDVAGIWDVVLKTTFGIEWILKNATYILSLKRKLISVGQLDNEGYHIGFGDLMWKVTRGGQVVDHGCKRGTLYMVEILVTEWSGENLTKDVDREAEKKNAISERIRGGLCRKLGVRLHKRIRVKLCNKLREQVYALRAELQEKSTRETLKLDLVSPSELSNIVESLGTCTDMVSFGYTRVFRPSNIYSLMASKKAKVKRWMFKCVKAFSHVNFDKYICVALSGGLLIAGKEDLTCVETLYGWVVGFDDVLVAESNMTKISKPKRRFPLEKNLQCRSLVRLRHAFSRTEEVSRACPIGSVVRRGWNRNIVEGMIVDLLKLLETESRSAFEWEIVEL